MFRHVTAALAVLTLSVALAAGSGAPDAAAAGAAKADPSAKLEKAAAKRLRTILKQSKKELKAAYKSANGELKTLRKALLTGRGLAALGLEPLPTKTGGLRFNTTMADRIVTLGSHSFGGYQFAGVDIAESAYEAARSSTEISALFASPAACPATAEGGLLRRFELDFEAEFAKWHTRLERGMNAWADAADATGASVVFSSYMGVGGELSLTPATTDRRSMPWCSWNAASASGRVTAGLISPEPSYRDLVPELVARDGNRVQFAPPVEIGRTGTHVHRVWAAYAPGPDPQYWLWFNGDDDADGDGGVPLFRDLVVIPGPPGDDPPDEPFGCSLEAEDLAFAVLDNARTEYRHPAEARMTLRGGAIVSFDLSFVDDAAAPVGKLRFSIVDNAVTVPMQGTPDGTHVEVRLTPDLGALPDMMLDTTGGLATDAQFLDPGDEYEILLCFSVDPRAAPAGTLQTRIRILGSGRAGVLYAPPYVPLSFDYSFDGSLTLIHQ